MTRQKKDNVFVDSNYFIALINKGDSQHDEAIKISYLLDSLNIQIVISNLVFIEMVTILSQQKGRSSATTFGNGLMHNEQITIVHVNEALQRKSWHTFASITKKNMSFVDCSILTIMKDRKIKKLLTFDKKDFSSLRMKYGFSFVNNFEL